MNTYDEIIRAIDLLDCASAAANPPNPCTGAQMALALSNADRYATEARETLARLIQPEAS